MKLAVNGRKELLLELSNRFKSRVPSFNEILEYAQDCFIVNMKHKSIIKGSSRYKKRKLNIYERAFRDIHLYCIANKFASPFGYIYIVSNPAWIELKIGSTIDAESRLLQYNTYSPKRDYKLEGYILVPNYEEVEKQLHKKFKATNEWVNIPLEQLKLELKSVKERIYRAIV